jgi:hypothetical protein
MGTRTTHLRNVSAGLFFGASLYMGAAAPVRAECEGTSLCGGDFLAWTDCTSSCTQNLIDCQAYCGHEPYRFDCDPWGGSPNNGYCDCTQGC